jgi:hypothetical protein
MLIDPLENGLEVDLQPVPNEEVNKDLEDEDKDEEDEDEDEDEGEEENQYEDEVIEQLAI